MRSSKIVFATLLILGMLGSLVFAKELDVATKRLDKTFGLAQANGPALSTLNINNIEVWVRRDGAMPPQGTNAASGDYPKGVTNMIFAEGMVWGVKVYDGRNPVLRVGGSTYATGHKAGKVLGSRQSDGDFSSDDHTTRHIWRVRRDWNTTVLTADAASFNQVPTADVTDEEVDEVYAQYQYDWNNWPADEGAPYEDADGDGQYTPAVWQNNAWVGDIPGFPGASQTLWTPVNDFPFADGSGEIAPNAYGSIGIGFEEQLTVWGYDFPASNPLGNIQFKRARLIYYGRSADAHIDTAYFTQWSDPDLGDYGDDYVGFDTVLSLGYVYNGSTLDAVYNGSFGLAVPAGGYDFLQGPKVDGVPLGMTSDGYFGAGGSISDPDLEEYTGTLQWFNLMEGFVPIPEYPTQTPWVDNEGNETIFPLAGDPVTGIGDIDGELLPPGDRRLLMSSGPFTMVVGDTQDVVLALIGATGGDNLSSITVLKYFDIFAQFAYDNGFVLPSPPTSPVIQAFAGDGTVTLNWGSDADAVINTEVPVNSGFEFEGYKVYQLPNAAAIASEGELIAIFDLVNGIITITEQFLDQATGLILELPAHVGSDGGVRHYMNVGYDFVRDRPITNDRPYYYGVSAYSYLEDNANSPFKSLESSMSRVTVTPQIPGPDVGYYAAAGDTVAVTLGSTNMSDGSVSPIVLNPAALVDMSYEVTFTEDLNWNLSGNGNALFSDMENQSGDDLYPIINGMIVKVSGPPLEGKDWDYISGSGTGERWFSGEGDGELLFGGAYLGNNFQGSNVAPADFVTVEIRWGSILEGTIALGEAYTVDTGHANASRGATYNTWSAGHFVGIIDLPFSAWDVSGDTPRQLDICVRDRDQNGLWDVSYLSEDESVDLQYNYVFIMANDYSSGESWDATDESEDFMAQMDIDGGPVLWAMWLSERGRPLFSDDGTLVLVPNAVNSPVDVFSFTTESAATLSVTDDDLDMINIFPNPYYGFHRLEIVRSAKYATINHLPKKATIRIFNLGGNLVRTIEKDDVTQYAEWDLENQYGFPVASGVYVIHIDLPDAGKEKVLKFALVQEEQILLSY